MNHLDELKPFLEQSGFKIGANPIPGRDNLCTWYAYRRSEIEARPCECNEKKRMQIVVTPHHYMMPNHEYISAEVEVCGESDGVWFKLKAYSIRPDELTENLPSIERSLIAAWNALTIKETA